MKGRRKVPLTTEQEDLKASARRIAAEPFFDHLLAEMREHGIQLTEHGETPEDLRRAKAWHQAASWVEAAVRGASKP